MSASTFESTILTELSWRGLIKQATHTEALDARLAQGPVVLYCGFDPSGPSLHVGHLFPVMGLCFFLRHGHRPLALAGGATGMIGDPSGKSEERNLLSAEDLAGHLAGIQGQLGALMSRALVMHPEQVSGEPDPSVELLNNADWMGPWTFLDFLRDVGKHFRVNQMMLLDSVKTRLESREQGLSYTEFSYMLLQAYDFYHLHEHHGCALQLGGSDQWGNITMGTELIRRKGGSDAYGLTMPLLTDADGNKIGKTQGQAVWLDPERMSPYRFYQYWLSFGDDEMGKLLRAFTFLPREEIERLDGIIARGENRGDVQRALAWEVTSFVHGEAEAERAVRASKMLFGERIADLSDADLADIFADVPSYELSRDALAAGVSLVDLLVDSGLQGSKSQARRLLASGGAYINNEAQDDAERTVTPDDLASPSMLVLRSGKKKYMVVRVG